MKSIDYNCSHCTFTDGKSQSRQEELCSIDCFLMRFKSSHCLIEAVLRMYEASSNFELLKTIKSNSRKYGDKEDSFKILNDFVTKARSVS
jgi:hypothetical protein